MWFFMLGNYLSLFSAGEIPAPLEFSGAGPALDVPEFESLEALEIQPADLVEIEGSEWGNGEYGDNIPETVLLKQEILEEGEGLPEFEDHRVPEIRTAGRGSIGGSGGVNPRNCPCLPFQPGPPARGRVTQPANSYSLSNVPHSCLKKNTSSSRSRLE